MSDSIKLSQEDIKRKIRDGVYSTYEMDSSNNQLWKCFLSFENLTVMNLAALVIFPTFSAGSALKCCHTRRSQVRHLTFDVIHPVVSHPRHHQHCRSATFFRSSSLPGRAGPGRAGPSFLFTGPGRADFCINLYGPGRAGLGQSFVGPGRAGPRIFGPCRPLVGEFEYNI